MLSASTLLSLALVTSQAFAWSPTDSYAPGNVTCPSKTTASNDTALFVRAANSISADEISWLEKRHEQTDKALKSFLNRANLTDFDVDDFFDSLNSSLNIGLAFSGGGYRAMINGAGQLSGLDDRTDGATEHGLGGLLQSATYLAGLSGGNWLTTTLAVNNWTSVQDIINQDKIWDLEDSIINSGGWNIFSTVGQWDDIDDSIDAKQKAGFNTSLTDIWGRALSYQFFADANNGGDALTFSGVRDFEVFQNGSMPFPISVANGRTPGTQIINENSTVFEFNPFELGSWDPSLYAFTDLKYLGTDVENGEPTDSDVCIAGFDNAGFVLGTSSSLFNQFLLQLNTTGLSGVVYNLIEDFLENLSEDSDDIAIYNPNPFYKTEYALIDTIVEDDTLYLVDGGEDLQNVPLAPLIQPERNVDVIFAFDNSADTDDSFPNGASLVETYQRQFTDQGNLTSFPYVPGQDTFLEHNLTSKPTFFGCYASNLTDLPSAEFYTPPLVVYIANTAYDTWSNTSTYKMSYENKEKLSIIKNGFEVATRYNLTIDSDWPKCVSCAIIQRANERQGVEQSDECKACFDDYCWNGEFVTSNETITQSGNWTSNKDIGSPDTSSLTTGVSGSATAASNSDGSSSTSSSGSDKKSGASYPYGSEYVSKIITFALIATLSVAFM